MTALPTHEVAGSNGLRAELFEEHAHMFFANIMNAISRTTNSLPKFLTSSIDVPLQKGVFTQKVGNIGRFHWSVFWKKGKICLLQTIQKILSSTIPGTRTDFNPVRTISKIIIMVIDVMPGAELTVRKRWYLFWIL